MQNMCGPPNYLEEAFEVLSGKKKCPAGDKSKSDAACLCHEQDTEQSRMEKEMKNMQNQLECARKEHRRIPCQSSGVADCDKQRCFRCPPCPAPCNPNTFPTAAEREAVRLNLELKKLQESYIQKNAEVGVLKEQKEKYKDLNESETNRRLKAVKIHQDVETTLQDVKRRLLKAEGTADEQNKQMKDIDMDNARISEQINLELQRIKLSFHDKCKELLPLPEMLSLTREQIKEAQKLQLEAEHKAEKLAMELHSCVDKLNERSKCKVDNMISTYKEANEKLNMLEGQMKDIKKFIENDGTRIVYKCKN